jgi:hypothetical protein
LQPSLPGFRGFSESIRPALRWRRNRPDLAMSTRSQPDAAPNGSGAAAILGAGVGCFAHWRAMPAFPPVGC